MATVPLSSRLVVLHVLALVSCAASVAQQPARVKFRTTEQSMIVVPVTINGAGPFDFQLDTGCTSSIVDQQLADELHLTATGRAILDTAQAETVTTVARVDTLKMGDASVTGLDVLVVDRSADLRFKVRGVLGENFLRHFDVYIDNRHHVIQLETGPGSLEDMLSGERLPLSSSGTGGESVDSDRLVIVGQFDEMRTKDVKLQIDSGTPQLLLCAEFSKPDFWKQSETFPVGGILKGSFDAYAQMVHLRLGKRFFTGGVVAVVPKVPMTQLNVDGFVPTSMFRSIFISHSGRFVILDPSAKKVIAHSMVAKERTADPFGQHGKDVTELE